MLITICQIRNVRKMFKALIEESGSGKLDKQDLLTLSASILRSFERSGVVVNDASRAAMQESIVAAYLERNDTVITIKHFTQLFDTFRRVVKSQLCKIEYAVNRCACRVKCDTYAWYLQLPL